MCHDNFKGMACLWLKLDGMVQNRQLHSKWDNKFGHINKHLTQLLRGFFQRVTDVIVVTVVETAEQ